MEEYVVLYNPLSDNLRCKDSLGRIREFAPDTSFEFFDILKQASVSDFIKEKCGGKKLLLCGGDGTLSRFANDCASIDGLPEIYFFPAGTGNDFARDVGIEPRREFKKINEYLAGLPVVTIKSKKRRFINGVGYGIDGYVCEEGDRQRELNPGSNIDYTAIALKGLLFRFKPKNAVITVDGVTREYENVWLAPCMNGRYYGGGMMPAPGQDRMNAERKISVMVWHSKSKLRTLTNFPKLFNGTHVKVHDTCEVLEGYSVKVEFDAPCALQVDGETSLSVRSYEVHSSTLEKN